jgi:hypothetical protein
MQQTFIFFFFWNATFIFFYLAGNIFLSALLHPILVTTHFHF